MVGVVSIDASGESPTLATIEEAPTHVEIIDFDAFVEDEGMAGTTSANRKVEAVVNGDV